MGWDRATQAAINRAVKAVETRAREGRKSAPIGPTPFQEEAARRATRLVRQAGPEMNMELDPRYRENMVGSLPPASAYHGLVRTPMTPLSKAIGIAESASKRRVAADKRTGAQSAAELRAANKRSGR